MFLLIKLLNPSNLSTVIFYRYRDIHFIGLFCFSYFISTYILKCYSRQLSLTLSCFVVVNICYLLLIHVSQCQSPITLKWLNLKLNNFDLILKCCHTLSWPLPWYLHSCVQVNSCFPLPKLFALPFKQWISVHHAKQIYAGSNTCQLSNMNSLNFIYKTYGYSQNKIT